MDTLLTLQIESMTIFAQYYMYQWLQCGIKYAIYSRHISPPAQEEAEAEAEAVTLKFFTIPI